MIIQKVWILKSHFFSWSKGAFIQPPTIKHLDTKRGVIVLGLLVVTNGGANSDKVATMLVTESTQDLDGLWWCDEHQSDSVRKHDLKYRPTYFTGKNCLNNIVLFCVSVLATKFSKTLNLFFFTDSHEFCPSRSFLRIVFEPLWKSFKLPNIFLSFFLSKHSHLDFQNRYYAQSSHWIFSPALVWEFLRCSKYLNFIWFLIQYWTNKFYLFWKSCDLIEIEDNPSIYHLNQPDQIFGRQWRDIFQKCESVFNIWGPWQFSFEKQSQWGKVAFQILILLYF